MDAKKWNLEVPLTLPSPRKPGRVNESSLLECSVSNFSKNKTVLLVNQRIFAVESAFVPPMHVLSRSGCEFIRRTAFPGRRSNGKRRPIRAALRRKRITSQPTRERRQCRGYHCSNLRRSWSTSRWICALSCGDSAISTALFSARIAARRRSVVRKIRALCSNASART